MKVVVFETEEWEHQACLRLQPEHQVVCTRDALDEATAPDYSDAQVITSFVNSTLGTSVLARFPDLKLIATRSTGYDHIDLAYCRSRGIVVSNVPDYGDSTVAEHAFALLLAVARHLVEAVERTRRGNFSQSGLRGFELRDKMLGVIGTGRIGRRAIEIARGFGMAVVAFDLHPDEVAAHRRVCPPRRRQLWANRGGLLGRREGPERLDGPPGLGAGIPALCDRLCRAGRIRPARTGRHLGRRVHRAMELASGR